MKIIDFLKSWIKDISIIFVLVSIIEIVLPNSNMKKYIDMIIGLLIIFVLINPFIKLLYKDFNIDKGILKNNIEQVKYIYNDNPIISSKQEEQVKEIYLYRIKEDMKDLVKEKTKYKVDEISLSIVEDEINYGNIKNVEIIIMDENNEEVESKDLIVVDKIETINIGKKDEAIVTLKEFEKDEAIKNIISKHYNIPNENITVFLNTMGKVN